MSSANNRAAVLKQLKRQLNMSQSYIVRALSDKYCLIDRPSLKEAYEAKSTVRAILPKKDRRSALVVCRDGEIAQLSQFSVNSEPRVDWESKLLLKNAESNEKSTILHAAYDWCQDALFISAEPFPGVCYGILREIAAKGRSGKGVFLQQLLPWNAMVELPVELGKNNYQGLTVDSENRLLFVCEKQNVSIWSIKNINQLGRVALIPTADMFKPGKVAVYLDDFSSEKALLTVSSKGCSGLNQMQLNYQHKLLSLGAAEHVTVNDEAKSTLRLATDKPATDLHVDKLGNMFIVNGEGKIQIIPCVRTLESFADCQKNETEEFFPNTTWASLGSFQIDITDKLTPGSGIEAIAVVKTANEVRIFLAGIDFLPVQLKDRINGKKEHRVMQISGDCKKN